jgi:hypothetical protein
VCELRGLNTATFTLKLLYKLASLAVRAIHVIAAVIYFSVLNLSLTTMAANCVDFDLKISQVLTSFVFL